jgi:hypothetical protein
MSPRSPRRGRDRRDSDDGSGHSDDGRDLFESLLFLGYRLRGSSADLGKTNVGKETCF